MYRNKEIQVSTCDKKIDLLVPYIGQQLEIHYLESQRYRVFYVTLTEHISASSFYAHTKDKAGTILLLWDHTYQSGKDRDGIHAILTKEGEKIYENKNIPFKLEEAVKDTNELTGV